MDICYVGLYLLTVFLKPKYAPMKVSGTEIQNQSANMATRVPNGMAAEEPSPHRIKFITKKSANTTLSRDREHCSWRILSERVGSSGCVSKLEPWCLSQLKQTYPGQRKAVSRTLVFHFSPPKADINQTQRQGRRTRIKSNWKCYWICSEIWMYSANLIQFTSCKCK